MTNSDSANGGAADTGATTATEKKMPRTTGAATSAVKAEIDAGIRGLQTTAFAEAESMRKVKLTIEHTFSTPRPHPSLNYLALAISPSPAGLFRG